MPTEADARIVVDRLLREADWDIENKAAVATEEPAADGRADYLLKNSRTRPLCILETKRFSPNRKSAIAIRKLLCPCQWLSYPAVHSGSMKIYFRLASPVLQIFSVNISLVGASFVETNKVL